MNKRLLVEGGASGHLAQMQELGELTFAEILNIFKSVFSGDVELKEKIDGIALTVTMKDGEVYFSRNKSTLKTPLSVEEAIRFFSDRNPEIRDTFYDAIYDLESALKQLSPEEQDNIFADGHNFINLEIVNVGATNIIDYGLKQGLLIFHGLQQFDDNWHQINTDSSKAVELYDYLKSKNLLHQKSHDIVGPVILKIKSAPKASKALLMVVNKLDAATKGFSKDTTLLQFVISKIINEVKEHAEDIAEYIDNEIVAALISRSKHALGQSLISIADIIEMFKTKNEDIDVSKVKSFIKQCQTEDWLDNAIVNALDPIVDVIIEAGQLIIECLSGFIAADPRSTTKKLEDELNDITANASTDQLTANELKRYETALQKLNRFNNQINATEGIVFSYNGKIYKLTSTFGPLNQLIGLFKFRELASKTVNESNDPYETEILNQTMLNANKDKDFVVYICGSFKPPHLGHLEMIKKYSEMKLGKKVILKIMVSDPINAKRPLDNGQIISGMQAVDAISFLINVCGIKNVEAIETSNDSPYNMIFDDITEDDFKNSKDKIIVLGISDKESEDTISGLNGLINSVLEELDDSDLSVAEWPKFVNPASSIIRATDIDDKAISATDFRKALSTITSDTPIMERISLVRPFLPKELSNEEILDYLDILNIPMEKTNKVLHESTFRGEHDWKHGGKYDYAKNVITDLLDGIDVATGSYGDEEPIFIDMFNKEKLKDLLVNIENNSYESLDDCLKKNVQFNGHVWNNIFKGKYSKYVGGLASKNKGNAFEQEFIDNFNFYKSDLENAIQSKIYVNGQPIATGALNQKRPLGLDGDQLYVTPKNIEDVGSYVTDITVPLRRSINGKKELYLSLKYGNTVTFINCGIKNSNTFPQDVFIEQNPKKIGPIGNAIIKMFGINTKKFIQSFDENEYSQQSVRGSNTKNTTNKINYEQLYDFLRSVIGCGYILVHKIRNEIHCYDLRTPTDLEEFIGNIISVTVDYPISGNKKRVDINVETSNLKIKFNIRSKDGGYYPTHLMSDYIIKH